MTFRRPDADTVRALLENGDYVRAATSAKDLAGDDPLVLALADELATIGNRKKNGKRGPRESDCARLISVNGVPVNRSGPSNVRELSATMQYQRLMLARDIVDGRKAASEDFDLKASKALLRRWNLGNVTRQQFRTQMRTAIASKYKIAEEKVFAQF